MKGRNLDHYGPQYHLRRLVERRAIFCTKEGREYRVDRKNAGNKTWGVVDYLAKKLYYIFV